MLPFPKNNPRNGYRQNYLYNSRKSSSHRLEFQFRFKFFPIHNRSYMNKLSLTIPRFGQETFILF